jgi:uncharacterized protein
MGARCLLQPCIESWRRLTVRLEEVIAAIPFEDHHVHAPFRENSPLSIDDFRRPFTESPFDGTWKQHVSSQLGYRWMLSMLADLLGVEADEAEVVRERSTHAVLEYHRLLAEDVNLGASYADDLFASGECYDISEWSQLLGGRTVHRVLRIETFVEHGYATCESLDDTLQRLTSRIETAKQGGIISLKSIAGYRTGLDIQPPSTAQRSAAARAYLDLREASLKGGSGRIANKDLVDTLVWSALEASIPAQLPMQFHVAVGDDDIVMTANDPTLMRSLLSHEPFRSVPIVLLHCYPYHRQAGYLASIYPNVYVDLGLTIPLVGPGAANVLRETLELTPVSQLLASTDGHMTPEFQWFGVRVWRWAVKKLLDDYLTDGVIASDDTGWIATAILNGNARRIYRAETYAGMESA